MGRKKLTDPSQLLTKLVGVRLTDSEFEKLEDLIENSDCHSVAEMIRRIVFKREIVTFTRDASMDPAVEQLIRIHTQLCGIANNINQITRSFHTHPEMERKILHGHDALNQFTATEETLKHLVTLVEGVSKKWLQK